jgi:hypothetical protein
MALLPTTVALRSNNLKRLFTHRQLSLISASMLRREQAVGGARMSTQLQTAPKPPQLLSVPVSTRSDRWLVTKSLLQYSHLLIFAKQAHFKDQDGVMLLEPLIGPEYLPTRSHFLAYRFIDHFAWPLIQYFTFLFHPLDL